MIILFLFLFFPPAALDAMRKAHEAEVQKEVTKFKTEFLKKIQSNHDIGTLHKEHEYVFRHCCRVYTNTALYWLCFWILEPKWRRSKRKFSRCRTNIPSNASSRRTWKKNWNRPTRNWPKPNSRSYSWIPGKLWFFGIFFAKLILIQLVQIIIAID